MQKIKHIFVFNNIFMYIVIVQKKKHKNMLFKYNDENYKENINLIYYDFSPVVCSLTAVK